jgi:DNA topoisomerase-1
MAKNLVIVESPAKAKTINKYLGRDYLVKSSYGHVRDLPTGGDESDPADRLKKANEARAKGVKQTPAQKLKKKQAALIRRMGVDPEHGWAATYEIVPGKEKVIKELQEAAEKADKVWLASDLDREGEAIAWHLKECIGGPESRFARVTFNEITKDAIQQAFEHPGQVNQDRVQAQQARRFLDRVVGFQVSPLLWAKVARGLSAGRVQSVAVRLIVEREREIKAFKPDEFWELHADLEAKAPLRAQVMRRAGAKFEPKTKSEIDSALKALDGASYRVAASERKPQRSFPSAPFITSTLQAAASIRLGFSVKKTMTMAQRLYEAGHITYMRTDSVNLSAQAVTAVRELIGSRFGAAYLPEKPIFYKSKAGAQEAHEAIRPTDANLSSQQIEAESDALRLYDLIWRQFVACQMPPAEFDTTTVTIAAADCELAARGRVLRFDGFFRTAATPGSTPSASAPRSSARSSPSAWSRPSPTSSTSASPPAWRRTSTRSPRPRPTGRIPSTASTSRSRRA